MIDVNKVAAVKLRQKLEAIDPAEPIKPPSFAAEDKSGLPRYIIYEAKDGRKDAVLDNAPSQANRIEPLFRGSELIPEVTVDVGDKSVSITELGHRSCDAAIRFSTGAQEIANALNAYVAGNAEPLAKLAPLDILFGSWDSRKGSSGAKLTRLLRSVIRATGVSEPIEKLGQYRTSINKEPFSEFSDKQLSEQGILDCPVSRTSDGVLVHGEIYRSAELNVRGIRKLRGESLQTYILGLGLFALTAPASLHLREGCNLVALENKMELVNENGTRTEFDLSHDDARTFALQAAKAFGVGQARHFTYDPKFAIGALREKKETSKKKNVAAAS